MVAMAFGSQLLSRRDACQPTELIQQNSSSSGAHFNRTSPCPLLCPQLSRSTPFSSSSRTIPWWKSWTKKYVILCCICGGTAVMLGVVFIIIYFTLHFYTSSLQYFETIPTYAPAVVLIITGLLVMCFARRRNRYAYLIKLAGGCCLVCAVLCVVITVTTTVIHMNRLQTLRECVYTQKSKICTCFAGIGDDEGAARYIFNNTPDCEVVHGSLYTCLRAMFGLSVIGILVCIFSSMLVYQLLSHEKKKMYWEQLEMRRRFFYRQPSHPLYCNCYDDYGFAAPHDVYHWQPWEVNNDRCWPARGMTPRMGFGTEDGGSQRSILVGSTGHRASGWNWLPWSRNRSRQRASAVPSSDSGEGGATCAANSTADYERDRSDACSGIPESPHLPLFAMQPYWTVETRFGPRRNGRRRRSNDAVFHHLNMTPPTRYQPPFVTDTSFVPPLSYPAAYSSLSRHMWGPPPPYSRPSSAENVATRDTPTRSPGERGTHPHHHRHHHHHYHHQGGAGAGSANSAPSGGGGGGMATDRTLNLSGDEVEVAEQTGRTPIPVTANVKMPRVSGGGALVSTNDTNSYSSEYESGSKRVCLQSTLADMHVMDFGEKVDGSSTVPSQRSRNSQHVITGSKSTPHLPKTWSDASDTPPACNQCQEFAIPVKCCVHVQVSLDDDDDDDRMAKAGSEQSVFTGTVDSYPSPTATDRSSSSDSFEVEDVETASNFRTSMVVSTTPSTPVNDNTYLVDMVCARSLPNLNLTLTYDPSKEALKMDEVDDLRIHQCERELIQTKVSSDSNGNVSKEDLEQSHMVNEEASLSTLSNNKTKIYCPGLSESSPTLPLSVPVYLQNADHGGNPLLPLESLFREQCTNYSATNNGTKSKSLGNLSPNDSIIVTFKSIHV